MSLDWKDVGEAVSKIAPTLGVVLGGPAGGAVGSLIAAALGTEATPSAVQEAIKVNPDAAVKLAQIESDQKVALQRMVLESETSRIASVNATMQAEAKSDHWPTYSWRPFNGFIVGTMAFGCYFILPLVHIPAPTIPAEVWLMFGGILGVASWFRGKSQADPTIPTDMRG